MKSLLTRAVVATLMVVAITAHAATSDLAVSDEVPIRTAALSAANTDRLLEAWQPLITNEAPIKVAVKHAEFVANSAYADVDTYNYIISYFADIPAMIEVARCESTFRQYDEYGNVLRGYQVSSDLGVMQINEWYHGEESARLGYDIYTIEGNTAYARHLYETQGLQPWSASRPCWGA